MSASTSGSHDCTHLADGGIDVTANAKTVQSLQTLQTRIEGRTGVNDDADDVDKDSAGAEASAGASDHADAGGLDKESAGAEASAGTITVGDMLMKPRPPVICMNCKNMVDFTAARLRNKTKRSWQCKKCNSRMSSLARHYGQWPPREFDSLTDAEITSVFNLESLDKGDLVRHVEGLSSKYKRDEHYYDSGGGYYPLSYYKNQGYTLEQLNNLEKNSRDDDKKFDPVLEAMTYRIVVMQKGERGVRGQEKQETIHAAFKKQRVSLARGDVRTLKAGESDDSESDDSSSSSSSAGGNLRLAQQKAERKAKRKVAKLKAKAAEKLKRVTVSAKNAALKAKAQQEKETRKAKKNAAKQSRKLKEEKRAEEREKKLAKTEKEVAKEAITKVNKVWKSLTDVKQLAETTGHDMTYGPLLDPPIATLKELTSSCANVLKTGTDARLPESCNTAKAINSEVNKAQKVITFVELQLKA